MSNSDEVIRRMLRSIPTHRHELVNECVIPLASDPLVTNSDVVDVVQQLLSAPNKVRYELILFSALN